MLSLLVEPSSSGKRQTWTKWQEGQKQVIADIFDSICFYSERSANPSNLCVPSKCFSFLCTSLCRHSLYQTTWHPWQDGELSSPPVASPFPISQRVWHPHSSQMIQPCRNVWFALIYIGILSQLFKIESDSLKTRACTDKRYTWCKYTSSVFLTDYRLLLFCSPLSSEETVLLIPCLTHSFSTPRQTTLQWSFVLQSSWLTTTEVNSNWRVVANKQV